MKFVRLARDLAILKVEQSCGSEAQLTESTVCTLTALLAVHSFHDHSIYYMWWQ